VRPPSQIPKWEKKKKKDTGSDKGKQWWKLQCRNCQAYRSYQSESGGLVVEQRYERKKKRFSRLVGPWYIGKGTQWIGGIREMGSTRRGIPKANKEFL